jgi:hypothetical protein
VSVDQNLLNQLDDFNAGSRKDAVEVLAGMRTRGEWAPVSVRPWMNLHCHTFHSYNSKGWSPSRLVYEAIQDGWEVFGSVDFDVMDAVEEVLEAGDRLGVKAVAGLESRVFVKEYASEVINSPGEPGVAYFMLTGCYRLPQPGTTAHTTLASLKQIAQDRNQSMIARVNPYLEKVQLDYEKELLPMTPSGNPTERHLVEAYDRKARAVFGSDRRGLCAFWAEKFQLSEDKVDPLLDQIVPFQETLRSKLMKKGGPGYVEADPSRFPSVDAMIDLGIAVGALPAIAWLDGTTAGEADIRKMISLLALRGVAALNIIPDRNWNLKDPADKELKIAKLRDVVEAAREFDLPLSVGTEMNKAGQPFIDDFGAPELQPFVEDFKKGARILWGHTLLARALDFGWQSQNAKRVFGESRRDRCDFYHAVGCRFSPGTKQIEVLKGVKAVPETILKAPVAVS